MGDGPALLLRSAPCRKRDSRGSWLSPAHLPAVAQPPGVPPRLKDCHRDSGSLERGGVEQSTSLGDA